VDALPSEWTAATIAELCEINPKHASDVDDDLPVSFIPMAAIDEKHGKIGEISTRRFGDVKRGYTHFADDDVLWAKITPCMENGKSAVARGLTNGIGCGTTEFYVLRSQGAVLPEYLHQYMRQESYRRAARATMQSGVGQARVPKEFIAESTIPLPPLREQCRILSVLEGFTRRHENVQSNLNSLPSLVEHFRRSVLAAAFRGDLTADWRAENGLTQSAADIIARTQPRPLGFPARRRNRASGVVTLDEALFHQLPPSWVYGTVDELLSANVLLDIADGNHGSLYPRKEEFAPEGVPFVTASQIRANSLHLGDAPLLSSQKAKQLTKGWAQFGDVLLTHNATVGRVARVRTAAQPFLLGTSVTYYRPHPDWLNQDYLFYALLSPQWQTQLADIMQQTTRDQVSIQKQVFLKIPIAPPEEQAVCAHRLNEIFQMISRVENSVSESLQQLASLEAGLLTKAFRGELVPQDPDDEPASVLLERIRAERERNGAGKPARRGWRVKTGA
jgi:type I restriction enzyme, S subunit